MIRTVCLIAAVLLVAPLLSAQEQPAPKTQRVLLIYQSPDNHPWSTHEYQAGLQLLGHLLQRQPGLQVIPSNADEPWKAGPELLENADAAVVFVSQGARWLQQSPERLQAFQELAERGGGLAVLHWGMGAQEAKYVDGFVQLFGACHGGPDRKYKHLTTTMQPVGGHPVVAGLTPLEVNEEFYYQLKVPPPPTAITPVIQATIDGAAHTVGWVWERPGSGRSFGFSGCHYHDNWKHTQYRRLALQGILWTLNREIPAAGLNVDVAEQRLKLEPRPAESPQ